MSWNKCQPTFEQISQGDCALYIFQRLAKHVMNVHLNALQMTEEPAEGEVDLLTLKKYIGYVRA